MKRIAIIGCGGINSWFIYHLKEVIDLFTKEDMVYVKLFDKDSIEEKNLLRGNQNFKVEDLMQQKAEVLSKRYNFDFENTLITEENLNLLDMFDDIILGVDNHKTRRILYDFCLEKGKYLLDMRAQGTQMGFVLLDRTKDMEYYDSKYFGNSDVMNRKGSCQLTNDVKNDHIENANKIIAFFGAYGIYLKHLRKEKPLMNEWQFVY